MSLILFLFSLTIMEDSENNLTIPLNMNISCPEFTEFSSEMLTQVSFWVEGALSCSVAMAGFLGNVGSVVILSGKEMRNSFNWLLIGLACFDNVYLLGSILESFRKDFEMVNITNYPFKRNSSEMINSWRDLFLKGFIPDGIQSWRDSFWWDVLTFNFLITNVFSTLICHFQETHTHVILFPYLFYPMQTIAMTGSILMTVAIAFERWAFWLTSFLGTF